MEEQSYINHTICNATPRYLGCCDFFKEKTPVFCLKVHPHVIQEGLSDNVGRRENIYSQRLKVVLSAQYLKMLRSVDQCFQKAPDDALKCVLL